MSDDQDIIIQDQPLKVLQLFHRRQLNRISFNQQKFSQLYDILCCTICRNLLNKPVYLRCSHRFCKDCIEKYIRINDNKCCPNCRGNLNTKRDLRLDYDVMTLINYSFGDSKKFCKDLQDIQNAEIQCLTLNKSHSRSSGIVRSKSFIEEQIKLVRKKIKLSDQKNINYQNNNLIRSKNNLINQNIQKKNYSKTQQLIPYNLIQNITNQQQTKQKKRKYSNSQVNIQIKQKNIKLNEVYQEKTNFIQKKKRGRKRKIVQEVQDIKNLQDSQDQKFNQSVEKINQKISQKLRDRNKKEVNVIDNIKECRKQIKQLQRQRRKQTKQKNNNINRNKDIFQSQKKPLSNNNNKNNNNKQGQQSQQLLNQYLLQQPINNLLTSKPQSPSTQFSQQKSLLRSQLGQDYFLKLLKIPSLDFLVSIRLQRYPNSFITPMMNCKCIQISTKCKIENVYQIVAKMLNVEKKNVRVYVNVNLNNLSSIENKQENYNSINNIKLLSYQEYHQKSINYVIQTIWKNISGVDVFDMKDILSSLEQTRIQNNNQKYHKIPKIFQGFYHNNQKQIKNLSNKKKGRKNKKIQQKQIKSQKKTQNKKIFYYQLFID